MMPKLEGILSEVAKETGIEVEAMKSKTKQPAAVAARRAFTAKARGMGYSFPSIGMAINRHWSSVMDLVEKEQQAAVGKERP